MGTPEARRGAGLSLRVDSCLDLETFEERRPSAPPRAPAQFRLRPSGLTVTAVLKPPRGYLASRLSGLPLSPELCRNCGGVPDLVIWVKRERESELEPAFFLCRRCYASKKDAIEFLVGIDGPVEDWWVE